MSLPVRTWCGLKQTTSREPTEKVREAPGWRGPWEAWPRVEMPWLRPTEQPGGRNRPSPLRSCGDRRPGKDGRCCCASLYSPLAWDCSRTKLGGLNSPASSERPSLPLIAVVASQAPRKVLGSSTFVNSSSSSSSRKGRKGPGSLRPGTAALTCVALTGGGGFVFILFPFSEICFS